jgi:uncharacterized protein YxeA
MKSIIVLLLLVLFFVSGMLFGVERERAESSLPKVESIDVQNSQVKTDRTDRQPPVSNNVVTNNGEYKQAPVHFTQKMASFIEGIVKGFYGIIVQVLYQITQLFY